MSVAAIIHALTVIEAGLPGVRSAFEFTPEGVGALPCFINYPVQGNYAVGSLGECAATITHVVGCDYLISRGNLSSAEKQARPIIDAFWGAIVADPTLNGSCSDAFAEPMTYSYAVEKFGGQDVLVIGFRVTCRI